MENKPVDDTMAMLTQLNDTLQIVLQKLDQHDQQLQQLDSVLYDGIIGPAQEQMAQQEYDNALSDFRCKYAEKLGPFEKVVMATDGEDVFKKAFDTYNDNEIDVSPDEYVDALTASLTEQIEAMKEALSEGDVAEAAHIAEEVKETAEEVADTTEESAHEEVNEKTEEAAKEEITDKAEEEVEEKSEESDAEKKDEDEADAADAADAGESLEDFTKSLEDEMEKNPPHLKY